MSKEEIPWDKVAKEIIKTLGVETGKGLYYGFTIQTLYPALAEIVRKVAGSRVSDDDIRRIIQEELSKAGVRSQQHLSADEIQAKVAQMLRETASSLTSSGAYPGGIPPQRLPADVEFEMEQIKNRISTLENTRNQLLSKKYMATSDEEKRRIEESIREIDMDIDRERSRLATIRSTYRI
jgi:hypothetical protein